MSLHDGICLPSQHVGGGVMRIMNSRSPSDTYWLWGQHGLHETLPHNTNNKKKWKFERQCILTYVMWLWKTEWGNTLRLWYQQHSWGLVWWWLGECVVFSRNQRRLKYLGPLGGEYWWVRVPWTSRNKNHVFSVLYFSAAARLPSPLRDCGLKQAYLLGADKSPWHPMELWEVPGGTQWSPCHALVPPSSYQHCQGWYHDVLEAIQNQVGRPIFRAHPTSPLKSCSENIHLLTTLFTYCPSHP